VNAEFALDQMCTRTMAAVKFQAVDEDTEQFYSPRNETQMPKRAKNQMQAVTSK